MAKQIPATPRRVILRRRQVEDKTGLARSTIYKAISDGTFPAPINLGPRSVGWIESEIEEWIEARIKPRGRPVEGQAA